MTRQQAAELRERLLPGSSAGSGYQRVLVLGPMGAGKSTLVGQLLGTLGVDGQEPVRPAVTRYPTESLAAPGGYWAVATFLSEAEMQARLTDCLVAAGRALCRDQPETVTLGVLVEHNERRFRLDQLLGDPASPAAQRFYGEILAALRYIGAELGADRPADAGSLGDEDLDRGFRAHRTLHSLTRQLGAHLADRLRALPNGSLHPPGATWPQYWTHGHPDRAGLLAALEPFLTEDRRRFGAIVAPLVNGLRVRGAFAPSWNGQLPYLEVLDSEGLIATPGQAPMLLPASILGQLERSDAILLIDDGRKPMGAVTSAAFAQLVRAGCLEKLSICFTHFDELEGLDPSTSRARRRFPQATLKQAGVALCQERGQWLEEPMQRLETQRVFQLAGLHLGQHLASATRDELDRLVAQIRFGNTQLAAPGQVVAPTRVLTPAQVAAPARAITAARVIDLTEGRDRLDDAGTDPRRLNAALQERLEGAELVSELGINGARHAQLVGAMAELYRGRTPSAPLLRRGYAALLVAYLVAEGIYNYNGDYLELSLPAAGAHADALALEFRAALSTLRLDGFDELVQAEASRVVPGTVPEAELAVILAHGALPVVALDAFFELASQGRQECLTGSQLLERWRAEPHRLACLPAPVSQFLGGGGHLAEQFVHGCWQLLELGATVSDPRQLTVTTGLPPHVINCFLASAPARAPRQGAHPGGSRPMA